VEMQEAVHAEKIKKLVTLACEVSYGTEAGRCACPDFMCPSQHSEA